MSDTDPPTPEEDKEETAASADETPKELTPEQQLEAYEKSLKEDDWGHQPC